MVMMTSFFNRVVKSGSGFIGAVACVGMISASYAWAQDYLPGTRVLKDGLNNDVSLSVQAELLDTVSNTEQSDNNCIGQGSFVIEEETCKAINAYILQPKELSEFDIVVVNVDLAKYTKVVDEWGVTIGGSSSVSLHNGDYRINGNATQWAQAVPKDRKAPLNMQVVGMNGGSTSIASSVYTLKSGGHVFEYDEALSQAYGINISEVDTVSTIFQDRVADLAQPVSPVHEFINVDKVLDQDQGYFITEGEFVIDNKPQDSDDDYVSVNDVLESIPDTSDDVVDDANQTSSSSSTDIEDEPELSFVEKYRNLFREDSVLAILFAISLLSAIAPTVSFPFIYLHGKKRRVEQV